MQKDKLIDEALKNIRKDLVLVEGISRVIGLDHFVANAGTDVH